MKTCYIIGAAKEEGKIEIEKKEGDFLICADGGLKTAEKNGLVPDLILGDFDSYGSTPSGDNVIVFPTRKDYVDSQLAIDYAVKQGYKNIIMFGMLGGRMDHSFANIQLLAYLADIGVAAELIGCGHRITAIKNSRIEFSKDERGLISVFSFVPESRGITIKGLEYEVEDFVLKSTYPIGVSNEFKGEPSYIEVKDGLLIIIKPGE